MARALGPAHSRRIPSQRRDRGHDADSRPGAREFAAQPVHPRRDVFRAALWPRSARTRFSLGMSAAARSDSVLARAQLGEALRLLPDDADPALDVATRTRIERQARDVLARIGSR